MKDPIQTAADLLKKGELVAFPTETVYGLGAPIFNSDAIAKIFVAKGRPSDNPLIAHIASLEQVDDIARDIPADFYRLAEVFFPGPLTLVLKKHPRVPSIVSGGLDTIALRMPNHPIAHQLIIAVGQPLVAPSANLSGKPSSTTAEHVRTDFGDKISMVIDGGKTEVGIESTVISLIDEPCLLRPGSITAGEIEKVLGKTLRESKGQEKHASPGTRYRHYAPKAKVKLFENAREMIEYLEKFPQVQRMVFTSLQASDLYGMLRKADEENVEEVVILCTEETRQNQALMDRLIKSAGISASFQSTDACAVSPEFPTTTQ